MNKAYSPERTRPLHIIHGRVRERSAVVVLEGEFEGATRLAEGSMGFDIAAFSMVILLLISQGRTTTSDPDMRP
jgi:hypothetical protein